MNSEHILALGYDTSELLRAYKNLKDNKKEELHKLLESCPKLGEAYRFRERFNDMWQIKNPEESKGYLQFWCGFGKGAGNCPI